MKIVARNIVSGEDIEIDEHAEIRFGEGINEIAVHVFQVALLRRGIGV